MTQHRMFGIETVAVTIGLAVGHAAMYGPQGAFMSELFGTRVRYSGASIGYQLASVLAGGLAPFIAVSLLAATGGEPWSVALYMIGMCVVTLDAVLVATETNTSDIAEEGAPARRPSPEPGGQAT